jgi:iron complex outermembrane recepter protein
MRGSRRRLRRSPFPIGPAALRQAAIGSVAVLALLPMVVSGSSFAQTAPDTVQVAQDNAQVAQNGQTGAVESIQVTGTRIREPNITATAPVVSVSDQEIKLEGTVNVENLLNNLPAVTPDQNSTVSNGSTGTATVDLRGLGVNRTLVLIDGKRLGPGDPTGGTGSAADLNFIPAPLVQSVEVLTGGASTDYGSDALAGVVNFKLKRDFEGIEIDQSVGFFQHDQQNGTAQEALALDGLDSPGNQLDGTNRTSTLIYGANSANGKGNITFYATDAHTDPVLQASRDFSACDLTSNGVKLVCTGSVNSPQGIFFGNVPQNADGTFPSGPGTAQVGGGDQFTTNPNGTASFLNTDNGGQPEFNFNPLNFLQREDQRYTAGGLAHYEVAPYLDIFTDFGFLDDRTLEQIAPGGLFAGSGPTGTINVNCNNPFLGASQAAAIGCNDPTFVNGQNQVAIITPGLRFAGIPRTTDFDHTDYRFVVGARGDLPYGFNYEGYVSYFTDIYQAETGGFASFNKVQDALLVQTGANGQPVCISGNAGCVPLNIFSRNGAVGAAEQSVLVNSLTVGTTTEVVADGSVSGDLGRFGIKSPLANDPVSVVAGYEYRTEQLNLTPDEENQTGDLLGSGGKSPPVAGSTQDNDFFTELHLPLVQDQPFVKAADIDLGFRHTGFDIDNSPQTFDNNTYKIEGDYQVIDDIKFRGGFDRAERNANIFELFTPATVGLTSGFNDPCAGPNPTAANPEATLANCERTGVTPGQFGRIVACPANQCSQLTGGNQDLKPEDGDTYTVGFVLTPTDIPNFTFTFDYFQINISNAIADAGVPANISLFQCLAGPSTLCSNIHRGPGGILFGQSAFISAEAINAADISTDGVDFTSSYKHDLDFLELGDVGSVLLNYTGTYTASLSTTPFPGAGSFNCAGLFGVTCGTPEPIYRHEVRTTYLPSFIDAAISLNWRHLSGVDFDGNQSNPLLTQGAFNTVTQHISSFDYFDLSATYDVAANLQVRAGINNLFDRDPPIVDANIAGPPFGNGNTYPGTYDSLGREFFFGATLKF